MKELQPLNQNVLLQVENKKENKTAGGIIIPSSVSEKPNQAEVAALGNIEKAEINVGDTVLFDQFSGKEIDFEGKKYILIPYANILAKIIETEEI